MQILLTPLSVFLTCPIHYYQITECNFPGGAASQYTGLSARPPVCLPVCQFQLASGEVSLTILTSTNIGEYRRVFYNYPGAKNEQSHTQTV